MSDLKRIEIVKRFLRYHYYPMPFNRSLDPLKRQQLDRDARELVAALDAPTNKLAAVRENDNA